MKRVAKLQDNLGADHDGVVVEEQFGSSGGCFP